MDFRGLVWKGVWKITFFGLKCGQDLENQAAHPHQEFPGVLPREASVPTPRYGQYLTRAVAMDSCFFLIRTHQHGERSRDFETRSLPCDHPPRQLLPRRVQKHWFTRQLHRREVVAVGWEPQNSSPTLGVWRWDQKNWPVCRFIGNCSSAVAAGEN